MSNATMLLVELAAGLLSVPVSLQADALDFFGDAVNYGITLFVLGMALHARAKVALSIWLCSCNDALGTVAVMLAAGGMIVTAGGWPDVLVTASIAGLILTAAVRVLQQAGAEIRCSSTASSLLQQT